MYNKVKISRKSFFRYHMNREDIYGHMASQVNQHYDLMELVMVCLGRPEDAEKGIEKGLSALVNSLKAFVKDEEELYQVVIENETYKHTTREAVFKYLK